MDIAWAAGIVEGEGCIRLNKCDVKDSRSGKLIKGRVSLQVTVAMKDAAVIDRLYELWGGYRATNKIGMHIWALGSNSALWFLLAIQKFVIGAKRAQLELGIEFQLSKRIGRRSPGRIAYENAAVVSMSAMKKIGVYDGPQSSL